MEQSCEKFLLPFLKLFRGLIMEERQQRKFSGKCFDCGGPLDLVELDIQGVNKIMRCQDCGMFHIYKKDFLGRYKLVKVTKILDKR